MGTGHRGDRAQRAERPVVSDTPFSGATGLPSAVVDAIGDLFDGRGSDDPGTVLAVVGTTPDDRDRLAASLAKDHDAPVFRLAPEDLVAPPYERMAAVLRLLDAAEVAGAVAMVDAANHLAPDRAAEIGLAERLARHRGLVVLVGDLPGRSPLDDVIDDLLPPT